MKELVNTKRRRLEHLKYNEKPQQERLEFYKFVKSKLEISYDLEVEKDQFSFPEITVYTLPSIYPNKHFDDFELHTNKKGTINGISCHFLQSIVYIQDQNLFFWKHDHYKNKNQTSISPLFLRMGRDKEIKEGHLIRRKLKKAGFKGSEYPQTPPVFMLPTMIKRLEEILT
jgi:hypothetical protein